ncbi:MAG: nuclear transport factor 2 family protein [Thermoanaerobaculia bacterium]|nr:nuclear transport factor 2 family protein [Thermoanaerobaculia bacterium]
MSDLEARVRRLEDVEAIRRLKARYCFACDAGYDVEALAELFTEDAVWDGGALGVAEGREAIRRFFERAPQAMSFAVHMVTNPLIEIDGDTATGAWYLLQAATHAPSESAVWGSARYDEEYVRTETGWKFRRLRLTSHFWTPYGSGWLAERSIFEPGG